METDGNQRWRDGRGSYQPIGATIRTADYEVAAMPDDARAKAFIKRHHYSASYPAARYRFGLFRGSQLAGVAVLSVPMRSAVLTNWLPCDAAAGAELGRLVLLDDVAANGESWFVARCFELARREGIEGVISFSDPVPRTGADGRPTFRGHIGNVYQALSARHYGRGKSRVLRILPDGTTFNDRTAAKIVAGPGERGFEYAVAQLTALGAEPVGSDPRAWLAAWLPRLTQPLKHPGNYRYAWGLTRTCRRHMKPGEAYPKVRAA